MMTIPIGQSTGEICKQLEHVLPEFTDAYFLVGVASNGEPIAVMACANEEQRKKINNMLAATLGAGGVPSKEDIEAPRPIPGMPAWIQN
jgi:hypothetical protein